MLKLITQNPYRILGVFSNSPVKDRIANLNKMKAYLKVGKNVLFPLDLDTVLTPAQRTEEEINSVLNRINMPQDQLKCAFFWFINATPIDNMALEYLQNGDIEKAKELFGKRKTFSSLINNSVLAFLESRDRDAIKNISEVISNEEYRLSFVKSICGDTYQISEDELISLYTSTLLEEFDAFTLYQLFNTQGVDGRYSELLKDKLADAISSNIISAIERAKSIEKTDSAKQLAAGKKLMTDTKADLMKLRDILGSADAKYQMIADKLANQILQCGINYYNNTSEDDDISIDKALAVQKYALSIAAGKLCKDRCAENCKILDNKKADLPPVQVRKDVDAILNALKSCDKMSDDIVSAEWLISETKPHLLSMKGKLFASDEYYLKISTIVVHRALHNIIEEVNKVQSDSMLLAGLQVPSLRSSSITKLKSVFNEAISAMNSLSSFDMDAECQKRYTTNKNSLVNIKSKFDNISSGNSYGGYSNGSSDSGGDFLEEHWGCLIPIAIFIIILIIAANS